jgi:hypothetical protein
MARPSRYRLVTALARTVAVLAVTGALSAATALPAHAAGGLSCRYTPTPWPGGFSADLRIYNNTATTIDGWTAFWTFHNATLVTNTWNGSITQGTPFDATGRNTVFNGLLRPGTSAALGWTASAVSADVPDEIIVNGTVCPLS